MLVVNLVSAGDNRFNGGDTAGLAADADGLFQVYWIANGAACTKCGRQS
jgi:hypothetical protein